MDFMQKRKVNKTQRNVGFCGFASYVSLRELKIELQIKTLYTTHD